MRRFVAYKPPPHPKETLLNLMNHPSQFFLERGEGVIAAIQL